MPLDELAKIANSHIRGWINYFGNFYRTELRPTLKRIDDYVIRWARRKFKRLRRKTKGSRDWFDGFAAPIQICSPTGSCVMATAEHREPCELRGSRTVLGEPGGEIPPGHSTLAADLGITETAVAHRLPDIIGCPAWAVAPVPFSRGSWNASPLVARSEA